MEQRKIEREAGHGTKKVLDKQANRCYNKGTKGKGNKMMKTYARYIPIDEWDRQHRDCAWYEVTKEKTFKSAGGYNDYVVINGKAVKAKQCEIIQVFEK